MSDDFNGNGPDDFESTLPESLIPYDAWLEEAHRDVMLKALEYAAEKGLPGEHHFYLTFMTTMAGVDIPQRLKERYPQEMTIVLQHQFRNLVIDRQKKQISVGLSFGGIPTTLLIPVRAIVAFVDPHVQFGLRFATPVSSDFSDGPSAKGEQATETSTGGTIHDLVPSSPAQEKKAPAAPDTRQQAEVVSLDAFRKRQPNPDDKAPKDDA